METREVKIGYKVISGVKVGKPATGYALQRVRYSLKGEWTDQPSEAGPLAVFETAEQAINFFERYGSQVWECEYIESGEDCLWKKNPPEFVKNTYGKGYHAEAAGITSKALDDCPTGTVFASRVRLTKLIVK